MSRTATKQATNITKLQAAYSEKLPGVADGFILEVVSKRPVAQHLKEGVMVHILSHIIQVIVLATSSNALQHRRCVGTVHRQLLPQHAHAHVFLREALATV